jgi:hypothetical protein
MSLLKILAMLPHDPIQEAYGYNCNNIFKRSTMPFKQHQSCSPDRAKQHNRCKDILTKAHARLRMKENPELHKHNSTTQLRRKTDVLHHNDNPLIEDLLHMLKIPAYLTAAC